MRRTGDEEEEENEEEEREEGGGRAALRIQNEDPTHRRVGNNIRTRPKGSLTPP